jgi:hypothetical protein
LRERPLFQTERGILLYHFFSALVFTAIALFICAAIPDVVAVATVFGLTAAHGIYSISFLELWSLAQGSYSISIVTGTSSRASHSREKLVAVFSRIGNAKKNDRIIALAKSSLIERVDDHWQLTSRGRFLAISLRALLWLSDIEKSG